MLVSGVSLVKSNSPNIVPTRVSTKRNVSNINFGQISPEESAELTRLVRTFPGLLHLGDRLMARLAKVTIRTGDCIEIALDSLSEAGKSARDNVLRLIIKRGQMKEQWRHQSQINALPPSLTRIRLKTA